MSVINPVDYQGNKIIQPVVGELSQSSNILNPVPPDAKTIARKLQSFNLDNGDEGGEGNG